MGYDSVGREEFETLKKRVAELEKQVAEILPMSGKIRAILVENNETPVAEVKE